MSLNWFPRTQATRVQAPKVLALLLCLAAAPAHAWWSCDWQRRFTADLDFSWTWWNQPPDVVLVRLELNAGNVPAGFDWSRNGEDLRVIDEDDQTELPFLIGDWNGSSASVWVEIDGPAQWWGQAWDREIYLYFDGPGSATSQSDFQVLPETGMKFHTRESPQDPGSRAQAEAAFASAHEHNGYGYGCTLVSSYTGISNQSLFNPNRNSDIALHAEVFFEVPASEAGNWSFRYGADFGRGGGLYVDGVALEEDWVNDLWWNNNWNNASEVLQGSMVLDQGLHRLSILGFEGCCDGGLTVQFRRPGGAWQNLATANIDIRALQCDSDIDDQPSVGFGAGEAGSCPVLSVSRRSAPWLDPVNAGLNPRAIPNAIIGNTIELENAGPGSVDDDSLVITEVIDPEAALIVVDFDGSTNGPVRFADGVPSSGLTYDFVSLASAADDLSFSDNGGVSFDYTPTPDASGVDVNVTHIRIEPSNPFAGNAGSGVTSAQFQFKTKIQ